MKLDDLVKQDVLVPGLSSTVSTVDRTESTVGRSPAAVFVITNEMIRRSGARYLPEVLRMAPGIAVAKIDAHTWAISARGFNNRFANRLLVQIDRRIIYNNTFGGVYWDQQDLVLEDVERIEVIRGPGTTMWGSNAVNGVINVITKHSKDTQGVLAQSGGGDQWQSFNTVRYGGQAAEDLTWRAFGQQLNHAAGFSTVGVPDAWQIHHGGFRMDYTPTCDDTLTLQGDILNGYGGLKYNPSALPAFPFQENLNELAHFPAGNVLLRYTRTIDEETSWQWQTYYDRVVYNRVQIGTKRDTYHTDFQYVFSPAEFHKFIAGGDYRFSQDFTVGTFSTSFDPANKGTQWASIFAQDEMTLVEDRWYFTTGVRLEQNTFGNFQPEPTFRLLYLPSERQSMWAAITRSARMPSRLDAGLVFRFPVAPPGVPVFQNLTGDPNVKAENLWAFELGYRAAPTDTFTWDIATYLNDYRGLVGIPSISPLTPVPPGYLFVNTPLTNAVDAISYGFETTATWQATPCWKWMASYSLFEINAWGDASFATGYYQRNPHNMIYLQSSRDVGSNWQWDVIGRYVDSLVSTAVPKYFEMDTRLAYRVNDSLEVSFVGQNLLRGHHLEFIDNTGGRVSTEVLRGWYGMITYKY